MNGAAGSLPAMARLRRAHCSGPGIVRRRRGRGFEYLDDEGRKIREGDVLARIAELAIPPAWRDVWICPYPNGHLQATGTDDAGRKQYLYHPDWRRRRDFDKFQDMVAFAHDLPALRERVGADLASGPDEATRERVLACAVRLLDRGFFRIGTEEYAETNESYGLATLHKRHVRVEDGDTMVFDFPAKSGQRRVQAVVDADAAALVERLKRRRGGSRELLAFKERGRWRDVSSGDINAYIKEATGGEHSAKDFRTWSATVLAAIALAVSGEVAGTRTGRDRAIARAVKEVAHYLGNTPAVCRASYIDPRVFDAYRAGVIIRPALEQAAETAPGDLPLHHRAVEDAVLDLLDERRRAPGIERIAA
jgi:DNA topoisomerase-1